MKDCIKSKFSKDSGYWNIFSVIFLLILSIIATVGFTKKICSYEASFWQFFVALSIFDGGLILVINVLKIRYYIITKKQLKYYSFWHPFGKILYFNDYIGKIITTETGSDGSYKVVYLVDKQNRTRLKLMGLHYKNFEEMIDAIPLKKIGFHPSAGLYFKLLFTGKIKVDSKENKNNRRKNKNAEQTIRKIIYIVVSIGLLCFVLGMIVKILSQLL